VQLQLTSLAQVSKAYGEILTTVRARVLAAVIEGVSLSKLSSLAEQHSELHEIDLNPVFVYPAGGLAVDARSLLA
jgi:ATP-grasp domain